ncbi:MAG: glycosyltransferase, partial [Aquihabitans sp.]
MSEPTWALIAGGGTAGHLLPGLSVARALVADGREPGTIHFVGAERGPEQDLVPATGFTVDVLPGRGIQRKLSLANVAAVLDLFK